MTIVRRKLQTRAVFCCAVALTALVIPAASFAKDTGSATTTPDNTQPWCWSRISLSSSETPSEVGDDVALQAFVVLPIVCDDQPVFCGGSVDFYDRYNNNTLLKSVGVNDGCEAIYHSNALTKGRHLITAVFNPPGHFRGSRSSLFQIVVGRFTTTMLSSDADPSNYFQTVTVTATVASDLGLTCTGMVRFSENGIPIRTATLTPNLDDGDAVATMTKRNLGSGSDAITAEYFGDSQCARSTGTLQQVVDPASTTLTLSSLPNPSQAGQNVTLSARVISANGARAIGTVTFTADTVTIGTVALSGNLARISTDALPAGPHSITATYNGGGNFVTSSATLTQNVK